MHSWAEALLVYSTSVPFFLLPSPPPRFLCSLAVNSGRAAAPHTHTSGMGDSAGWWPGATGRGGMIGSENGLTSEASHQRASVSALPPEKKASAMLEEATDNRAFGGCLEGHPT